MNGPDIYSIYPVKLEKFAGHPGDAKSAGAGGNFYFHYNLIRSSVTHVAKGPGSRVSPYG